MSEYDAIDAMIERMAREEQQELEEVHAEHLLRIAEGAKERRREQDRALLELLNRSVMSKEGGQEGDNA